MKKLLSLMIITLGVISCSVKEVETVNVSGFTSMKIYNHSKDTVLVYLTLGRTDGCIQDVNLIPWIQDSVPGQCGLQGTFLLMPGDSTESYDGDGLGFNGVVSFNHAPDNCPAPTYTNGINQFEFIINNWFQEGNPQETVDISCVHGVNCVIRVNLPDSNWSAGPVPLVQSFANTMNKNQIGIAGVFPYGCDDCDSINNPPSCIPLPQPKQKEAICNVQRNANQGGGLIKVIYLGKANVLE